MTEASEIMAKSMTAYFRTVFKGKELILMSELELRNALKTVRGEITRVEGIDEHSRQRLNHLLDEIELKLEQPQDAADHEGLAERLRHDIMRFETSHPDLTEGLNEVLMSLSAAGI